MIPFTQSTAVLHKYLNDELKILYLFVTIFPWGCTEFRDNFEFSMFREIPEYARFSRFVATLSHREQPRTETRDDSKYLRPVRSVPKKLTTPTLNTKLEKTVNRPAIPTATPHQRSINHTSSVVSAQPPIIYAWFPSFCCNSSVEVSLFPLAVAISVHRCHCRCHMPWLIGVDHWLASYGMEQLKK